MSISVYTIIIFFLTLKILNLMNKKLVIFGPWIGEFTYEISWWIPEIRELRNTKYKDFKSIAVSSKGRKILYSDFIDEFIYYPNNLESQRKYPSTKGEHVHYVGDIIPDNFNKFISELKQKYGNKYQVTCYSPNEFDYVAKGITDHLQSTLPSTILLNIVPRGKSEQIKIEKISNS